MDIGFDTIQYQHAFCVGLDRLCISPGIFLPQKANNISDCETAILRFSQSSICFEPSPYKLLFSDAALQDSLPLTLLGGDKTISTSEELCSDTMC